MTSRNSWIISKYQTRKYFWLAGCDWQYFIPESSYSWLKQELKKALCLWRSLILKIWLKSNYLCKSSKVSKQSLGELHIESYSQSLKHRLCLVKYTRIIYYTCFLLVWFEFQQFQLWAMMFSSFKLNHRRLKSILI